ncbi:MAG: GNAT family N-acetyltransferase [Alistipes sp.]|nr:GNAT family N-acetyltransferase [Alistipes sp.]
MILFREITVADKPLFDRYACAAQVRNCDMAFANIYCWQPFYRSEWAEVEGFLVVRFRLDGGDRLAYMQPLSEGGVADFSKIIPLLSADASAMGQPLRFAGLTPEGVESLRRYSPEMFAFAASRDFADYIYAAEDLRNLEGRKYQPKRNHINRFRNENEFRFLTLTEEHAEECLRLNELWGAGRADDDSTIRAEREAMIRAFENFDALGLLGGAICVGGELAAFTYGSLSCCDTFVTHIEKANTKYNGIFATINNLFARSLPEYVRLINREEDMGIEGLRKAKLSYYPVAVEPKWSAVEMDSVMRDVRRLWIEAFGDSEEFVEQFLASCYDPESLFAHREQGRVVSMVHLLPFRSAEGDALYYIYGVATDPEWRGRGFATELMLRALRRAESEGRAVVLIPSGEDVKPLYESLGFVDRGVQLRFDGEFDFGTGDKERDKAMILEFGEGELAARDSLVLKFED